MRQEVLMKTLLFLGDSITDCNHYFDPENLGYGYVRMISDKIKTPDTNYQVLNKGNDGFTVPALIPLTQLILSAQDTVIKLWSLQKKLKQKMKNPS